MRRGEYSQLQSRCSKNQIHACIKKHRIDFDSLKFTIPDSEVFFFFLSIRNESSTTMHDGKQRFDGDAYVQLWIGWDARFLIYHMWIKLRSSCEAFYVSRAFWITYILLPLTAGCCCSQRLALLHHIRRWRARACIGISICAVFRSCFIRFGFLLCAHTFTVQCWSLNSFSVTTVRSTVWVSLSNIRFEWPNVLFTFGRMGDVYRHSRRYLCTIVCICVSFNSTNVWVREVSVGESCSPYLFGSQLSHFDI